MEKANASPLQNISKRKDLEDILTLDILISDRLSKITGESCFGHSHS